MCIFLFVFFIYRTVIILGVFGGTSTPAVLHPFFRAENGRSFRFYTRVHVQSVHIDYFVFRHTVGNRYRNGFVLQIDYERVCCNEISNKSTPIVF